MWRLSEWGDKGDSLRVAVFKPVKDCKGERGLFQKSLLITRHAVADDLASAAHLLMGETNERTPATLIKGAPVNFVEKVCSDEMKIPPEDCVYMNSFTIKSLGRLEL